MKKNKNHLKLAILNFSLFVLLILFMFITSMNSILLILAICCNFCGMYFLAISGYAKKQHSRSIKFMDPYSGDLGDPAFRSRYFHHRNKIF